jgi:hypothetical protein
VSAEQAVSSAEMERMMKTVRRLSFSTARHHKCELTGNPYARKGISETEWPTSPVRIADTTFLRFQRHPAFRRAITLFTLGLPPFKLGARLRYSRVTVLGLLVGRQVAVNVRTGGVQGERPYSTAKIAALVAAIVLLIVLKSSH